jgi:pyruvate/2-oxoglutarate dehydrogenase complex dihydrolipoamide acyltransferase (E2) component
MMHAPPADEHLDDGALVRLIDGEAAEDERAGVEAHLAACPVCAARLGSLRRRSVNLGLLLARGDFAVPAPSVPAAPMDELAARREARRAAPAAPSRVWLRAAAVAALVIGAGLFSSPVRAWFRDLLGGAASNAPVAVQPAPAPAPAPAEGSPATSARVRFTPQGDELAVEIAHAQASGALVLATSPSSAATAEVRAPAGALADLLVLPTGLRIDNRETSVAEYHVAVPTTVQRVRVRIGTAPALTVTAAELAQGRRIELR